MKTIEQQLKSAGLSATKHRQTILSLLGDMMEEQAHLTANDIYSLLQQRNQEVSLATIYRVLSDFEKVGIVKRNHFDQGKMSYELADKAHHFHIINEQEGCVADFYDPELVRLVEKKMAEKGLDVQSVALNIYTTSGCA